MENSRALFFSTKRKRGVILVRYSYYHLCTYVVIYAHMLPYHT